MRRHILAALTAASYLLGNGDAARAEPLRQPTETPILTISGAISATNLGDTAQFDRPMLESLGTESFQTKTPWHEGVVTFEGVRMDALMKAVGATGTSVRAIALNDYVTSIPLEDFAKFGTILALKLDGEYMSVRQHGPLFIVYPYDTVPELRSQTFFGRSAWQVTKLVVE